MATARFRLVSVARYTCPMPPSPICAETSYGPRRVPGVRAKTVVDYMRPAATMRRLLLSDAAVMILRRCVEWSPVGNYTRVNEGVPFQNPRPVAVVPEPVPIAEPD